MDPIDPHHLMGVPEHRQGHLSRIGSKRYDLASFVRPFSAVAEEMVVEFRILGPLYADAGTGDGPVEIRQPLLQSALAVLLLRANRPCPREWLIDALWGNEPPDQPEAALRVCISRLRRCLGECAVRLESVGTPGGRAPGHRQQRGYQMTVRPGELDAEEFADLASQGEAELEMGNATAAATSLMQALELWGDPSLPDLPDTRAVSAAAAALKAQRRSAVDALIDARLAAGEYQQVLGQLRAAALADPSRERTCAQLMCTYSALGMRKEALSAYQRARTAMLEEQGAEPGPVLMSLQSQILAAEIGLGAPPAHVSTQPASLATLPAWQAPAPPSDFAGRTDELAEVIGRLSGPGVPIVIIAGGPGTGKSALAATAAAELRDRFPGGQLYVELGAVDCPRDTQDVLADVLHSLGVQPRNLPPPGAARAALYRTILGRNQVMVIADGAVSAAQVRPLVPAAAGSGVLVTSRGRLNGLEAARTLELQELPDEDALALLSQAVGQARMQADPVSASVVVRVCAGLPLALRLVGTVLASRPGLTVARLARELDGGNVLDMLTAEDVSVRASIGTSYGSLPVAARRALTHVAVHVPAEIPAWALTAVGSASVADVLAAAGLISLASDEKAGLRYRVHPLTRAYAAAQERAPRLARPAGLEPVLAGWLERADRANAQLPAVPFLPRPSPLPLPTGQTVFPEQDAGTAWLEIEKANLLAAVGQACEDGDHASATALASRMVGRQCITGDYGDAMRAWRKIAATADADGDDLASALASYYLAVVLADSRAHITEAASILAACLPAIETGGDPVIIAMGHALLGRCASACGRHAAAMRAARSALRTAGENRDGKMIRCIAGSVLGLTLARTGIIGLDADHCEQSLAAARELDEPAYQAAAVMALAQVRTLGSQFSIAGDLCIKGIRISQTYGSEITAARFLTLLGRTRQRTKDFSSAVDCLQQAMDIFQRSGSAIEEVTASSLLAACSREYGDRAEAAAHVGEILRILDREGVSASYDRAAAAWAACDLAAS
jgi:DNA-binding SARP family transcriptional activator